MIFHSLSYFLFLPVIFLLHHYFRRGRLYFLLASSLAFYLAVGAPYLLAVLGAITAITYCTGIAIDAAATVTRKRLIFWSGILLNVLVLVGMKYLPFLSEILTMVFGTDWTPKVALISIGVSYYVFQAIAYLANILLGIDRPERHLGYFALYMAFFPKILQGPIERPSELLPQLKTPYEFNYDNARSGLALFAWGLLKKVVVADRLAPYVDQVYGNVHAYTGIPLIVATYLYAIQIFCDFSGYTDMALGSARLFNINLTANFRYPYLATSVADFWRRWHISLSSWIMDYIFKPLHTYWRYGRNYGTAGALIIAFLISGVWHGAAWTFVIWGLIHGIYLSFSVFYKPWQKKIHSRLGLSGTNFLRTWQIFVTFNLVCFSWIFFRAASLADASYVVTNLFSGIGAQLPLLARKSGFKELICMTLGSNGLITAIVAVILLAILAQVGERYPLRQQSMPVRWIVYYATVSVVAFYGVFNASKKFIYFQF